MADDSSSDDTTGKNLFRQLLEGIGEGAFADRDNIPILDAIRIQRKLALAAVETPKTRTFAHSDVDIERLWTLTGEDYARVHAKWRKSHSETAMSLWQLAIWAVAFVGAPYLAFNAPALRLAADPLLDGVPVWGLRVLGVIIWLGALMTSESAVARVTAEPNWEGYISGYEEGLRQGVNRALAITPEQEKAMWTNLKEGELARVLDTGGDGETRGTSSGDFEL